MLGRLWDWWRAKTPLIDAFFAAPLVLLSVPEFFNSGDSIRTPVYLLLSLVLIAPLVLRRTFPRTVFAFIALVAFAQWLNQVDIMAADIAVLMALYAVAAYQPRRWGVAAALVAEFGVVLIVISGTYTHGGWEARRGTFIALTIVVVGVWILGLYMRTRRAYMTSLEERAERLELEREQDVQIAMAAERARIARELHDVVAHNVSVIVVQADGASYAIETDTARAKQALEAISATGRQALTEMRRLLGVLREDETEQEYAPQPGVGQLADLIEACRGSGLQLEFESHGRPPEMPEGRQLTVFRIVQEALTNTLKHGGPTVTAKVRLDYGDDAVEISVVDDGRGAAAHDDGRGHGLAGMRERAEMYGGTVRTGPRAGGGFEVIARVPVREEVRT
ncbi:sensor histidine kinase [Actinomadura barringtoniae]|uniref:histidine kinase n=1 Tax=Actinomadura barringtoniae TaxID=1427535 RepID=A0A939PF67_9ACTN|nr:sensor histidine kinase [Actinomadura barringtoniae]MBO2451545.1 sensor histidine kinase [Actinomadura barringtoniae]